MDVLMRVFDSMINIDKSISSIVDTWGPWTYLLLFIVVFCETGLIVAMFLPGDSLLFTTSALAAVGVLNIYILIAVYMTAGISGYFLNYQLGKRIGENVANKEKVRFVNKGHMEKAEKFYAKYGAITIAIGRFVAFVRSFAPFLAGMGKMEYRKFAIYNVIGGMIWAIVMPALGYFCGTIPIVKDNLSMIIIVIFVMVLGSGLFTFLKSKKSESVKVD